METRVVIAYSIMLAMALTVAGIILYLWYNGRDRAIARRQLRENRRYEERRLTRTATEELDSN